jgi:trk system potassium uptake protein TrkH
VYIITFITILVGTFLFFWLERDHTLNHLSPLTALINSLFITVSARGIGFSTLSVASLTYASGLLIMALAFIGSSPGSPGSGVKTTTFAVLCAFIKSTLREDQSVLLYGRKVARDQLNRAITIVVLAISWIIIALFLMLICESHFAFFDLLFELVSAFGTLGLSTGITPHLHTSGKVIIMITTLVGRVGVISFLLSLLPFHPKKEFSYPEERIMLG